MDVMQPIVQTMELPSTTITAKAQTTTGTSVNSTQQSFSLTASSAAVDVPLNEDTYFEAPQIVCSKVNEDAELSGNKSFRLTASLTSTDALVSPVIDAGRMGVITVGNRTNEINTAANLGALTPFGPSTAASGDNNKAIYITKQIVLAKAATAIQVLFDAVNMAESDIQVMYRTLRVDAAEPFADIDWIYFNPGATNAASGAPDKSVPTSKNRNDFKEYQYFVGQNSLGLGTELPEFVSFAIKIIMRGTNSSLPPKIKDFRAIAFQA